MLWSVIRLIFKTSSVTPDFFYVFNLILSFSTCSQSFKKICAWELLVSSHLKISISVISSLSLKLYLLINSLVYHRNIFGSSSKVFGNLRQSSEIFGNSWKMFGNVRLTFGTILENLRKSSESGRKSLENHKKRRQ